MILIEVTVADGTQWINMDNVCSISGPIQGDPPKTRTVLVMSNGYRIRTETSIDKILNKLPKDGR